MRKYIHDCYTDYSYNIQFPKYNTPVDDTDSFLCYFWDVDINYNIAKRTYASTREYFPVAKMKLRHIPTVGMYLNFNSELYTIKTVCIVGREDGMSLGNNVCYDIEVQKIEEGEEL